jgi:hypothetical protein
MVAVIWSDNKETVLRGEVEVYKYDLLSLHESIALYCPLTLLSTNHLHHLLLLSRSERPPLPFSELSEIYILYSDTLETLHIMIDSSNHTANLSIFSFLQDYRELGRRETCNLTWLGCILASDNCILAIDTTDDTSTRTIVLELDTDTIAHLLERFILYLSIDLDDILLLMLIAWMHEVVRESSIIGQYDKSSRLLIESPDWEYSLAYIYHVHNPLFIILTRETGRYDITRLVIDIVDEIFLVFDDFVIDFYYIDFWIDNLANMRNNIIHRYKSLFDIFFCFTARADSCMCEVFLEFQV